MGKRSRRNAPLDRKRPWGLRIPKPPCEPDPPGPPPPVRPAGPGCTTGPDLTKRLGKLARR
jgi:hypothetical protein